MGGLPDANEGPLPRHRGQGRGQVEADGVEVDRQRVDLGLRQVHHGRDHLPGDVEVAAQQDEVVAESVEGPGREADPQVSEPQLTLGIRLHGDEGV